LSLTISNERVAVRNADAIISLNRRDATLLKKYYDRSPDMVLPITFDDHFTEERLDFKFRDSRKLQLLFVGSLFPPNEHGVTWFALEVMPYVNADFTIVGRNFERLAGKLNRNNVRVIGTVDELAQYYHDADAIVSPILLGAGMKVKTAEALMYGKPMFATDEALEGYDVDDLDNVYRCNTAQQFIHAINDYADHKQWPVFDQAIRNRFLERYNTVTYVSSVRELLESTMNKE